MTFSCHILYDILNAWQNDHCLMKYNLFKNSQNTTGTARNYRKFAGIMELMQAG